MVNYKCWKCGKMFTEEDLKSVPGIRCPSCGYRIIFKVRKPQVKIIKAV